jgi:hypothetical protein
LQQANLHLARLLKRRNVAYALLLLFPLGLHRDYLEDRLGAWSYRLAAAACVAAAIWLGPVPGGVMALALVAGAVADLVRMDVNVAAVNKRLRMQVYLRQTAGAPAGFSGHYTDAPHDIPPGDADPSTEAADRPPSFAEQEKTLKQIAALRRRRP